MRYFDTAPHYGLGALRTPARRRARRASARLLRALVEGRAGCSSHSSDPTGWTIEGFAVPATHRRVWDFSRDGIRRSIAESLERLGLDRLDIVYLHDPDDHWRSPSDRLRGARRVASRGRRPRHRRRHEPVAMLAHLVRATDVDVVMLAGRYTLLEQDALDDLLPLCCERRVAVVAAGVFNSGLLARHARPPTPSTTTRDAPRGLVERAQAIARICGRHGTTLPAAALAFPLAHPAVASVCVGGPAPLTQERRTRSYREAIAPDLWSELKAEGLLRNDAPVPGDADTARASDSTAGANSASRTPIDITEGTHPGRFCS